MSKYGLRWESISKHEKVCKNIKSMPKLVIVWQSNRECIKAWESMSKHEKVCQNLWKAGESMYKPKKVLQSRRKFVKMWESATKH